MELTNSTSHSQSGGEMTKSNYLIEQEEFQNLYDKVETLYAYISIILVFCQKYNEVENFDKLLTVLKHIKQTADSLYSKFINIKYK